MSYVITKLVTSRIENDLTAKRKAQFQHNEY